MKIMILEDAAHGRCCFLVHILLPQSPSHFFDWNSASSEFWALSAHSTISASIQVPSTLLPALPHTLPSSYPLHAHHFSLASWVDYSCFLWTESSILKAFLLLNTPTNSGCSVMWWWHQEWQAAKVVRIKGTIAAVATEVNGHKVENTEENSVGEVAKTAALCWRTFYRAHPN